MCVCVSLYACKLFPTTRSLSDARHSTTRTTAHNVQRPNMYNSHSLSGGKHQAVAAAKKVRVAMASKDSEMLSKLSGSLKYGQAQVALQAAVAQLVASSPRCTSGGKTGFAYLTLPPTNMPSRSTLCHSPTGTTATHHQKHRQVGKVLPAFEGGIQPVSIA